MSYTLNKPERETAGGEDRRSEDEDGQCGTCLDIGAKFAEAPPVG